MKLVILTNTLLIINFSAFDCLLLLNWVFIYFIANVIIIIKVFNFRLYLNLFSSLQIIILFAITFLK